MTFHMIQYIQISENFTQIGHEAYMKLPTSYQHTYIHVLLPEPHTCVLINLLIIRNYMFRHSSYIQAYTYIHTHATT